jgi:hypothetical protein
VNWTRAVHHVELAAAECTRLADLSAATMPVRVVQMWVFGDMLGDGRESAEIDQVDLALVLDLPASAVPWLTAPPAAEHWLRMTRLAKNPVRVWWRSAAAPVWNHRIVRPLLVWQQPTGLVDEALVALRERRGAASGSPAPTPEQLVHQVADELAVSLAALQSCTTAYAERQFAPTKLGPAADALWRTCDGYLDLLSSR